LQSVQLFYNGLPSGLFLVDDGTSGDAVAKDSLFTLQAGIEPGMPAGQHRVSLVAVDAAGLKSVEWPYVEVGASRSAQRRSLEGARSFQNEAAMLSTERIMRQCLLDSLPQSCSLGASAPVIMAGGFGFTDISSAAGGQLALYAHVESFGEGVEKIEASLEGGAPLGMFLHDDGVGGDAVAGDGQFTFQCALGGGVAPGRYLIELVGTTSAGAQSLVFPYVTVTP
ncbi:MAG TPA: choice-of-anchor X domain-containing protein, partial [bacterium]|nr:choice-of-anchor X domain-containing protein [bacterium]